MKLLRIKAFNYRNCARDIQIDFVPAARKSDEDKTYELNEIDEGLYTFTTSAIVGKNASGKTSVLDLINNVCRIFEAFKLEDELLSIDGTKLDVFFYHAGKIYNYTVELKRNSNLGKSLSFVDEKILVMDYSKSKSNKLFRKDLMKEVVIKRELPDDTSNLFYILKKRKNYVYYYDDSDDGSDIYHAMYSIHNQGQMEKKYWNLILQLFDENIYSLEELNNDTFKLKYCEKEINLSSKELFYMLSRGTTKGIALYTAAIQSLLEGSLFIIDEVENHFHKTLVENLISLFKDKSVNRNGACLLFSTHYCELLDLFARNDNVWITKSTNNISLTNMYSDYEIRNDLIKSKKFYDDTFGTAVSYEKLMNLKKALKNG